MKAFAQLISEDHLHDCVEQKELILTGLTWTEKSKNKYQLEYLCLSYEWLLIRKDIYEWNIWFLNV